MVKKTKQEAIHELNEPKSITTTGTESTAKIGSSSKLLTGMLNLITPAPTKDQQGNSSGIYLDDTEKLDSEVGSVCYNTKKGGSGFILD